MLEACEGLAEAHAAGLLHGDLEPQNIFLAQPPKAKRGSTSAMQPLDPRVLKLLDFGTTSPLDAIGDQSASAFFGSPTFLAPEQIQDPGRVDARADVWALGVLLYKLISGALPFTADSLSGVIVAVVYDAPALLTDAPYELARIVSRCLEKDPAERLQDVNELAAALAPFAGSQGTRLSERVRVMLETPPASVPSLGNATTTSSVAPVSISNDGRTRPSRRVTARRRKSRARVVASGVLGAAAALALASWALTRPVPQVVADPSGTFDESGPTAAAGRDIVDVPPYLPSDFGIVATTAAELPDAPLTVSFAPSSAWSMTPTPLAVAATPGSGIIAPFIGGSPVASPPRSIPPSALPSASPAALPNAQVARPSPRDRCGRPRLAPSRGPADHARGPSVRQLHAASVELEGRRHVPPQAAHRPQVRALRGPVRTTKNTLDVSHA